MKQLISGGPVETRKPYVELWFQIVLSLITMSVFALMTFAALRETHMGEAHVPVFVLTPRQIIDFGGMQPEVSVGLYLRDFQLFDMTHGNFIANITVWFQFDPRLISLDRVDQFTIERAEIMKRSAPLVRAVGDKLVARYDLRIQFTLQLNYASFPFDAHRMNISVVNHALSAHDVLFTATQKNLVQGPMISTVGWTVDDWHVVAGFAEEKLQEGKNKPITYYPRVVFSLDFDRMSTRSAVSIFLPLILIFLISIFSLSLDPRTTGVSNVLITVSSITALIAYRFVIENLAPSAGYFMISDFIFLLFLLACCAAFVINLFGTTLSGRTKTLLSVMVHLLICLSVIVLFSWI